MMHEQRMHKHSDFLTLTIDDEHLNENSEIRAKDLSGFIENLRKTQQRRLSFFGYGEYGETTGRPHYHAIVFGHTGFLDQCADPFNDNPNVWRSQTLNDIWGRGAVEAGSVTMASASYVAGYIGKKLRDKDNCRANPVTGELKTPEFARMSLRPAIGRRWIEQWWRDVYPRDYVLSDGHECKPPRYYDKWMDMVHEQSAQCNFGKACPEHMDMMETVRERRYYEAVQMTKYQMMSAEKIHEARTKLFAGRAGI